MDERALDGASPGQRLGLPFKVDLDTARARVVAHLGVGLLTPGDVRSAGSITSIKAIYVPARRVVAEAVSNWTAESGSSSGKQVHWTAVSGQHRGAWSGPPLLVARRRAGNHPWGSAGGQEDGER